jgi:hypothetical protein
MNVETTIVRPGEELDIRESSIIHTEQEEFTVGERILRIWYIDRENEKR